MDTKKLNSVINSGNTKTAIVLLIMAFIIAGYIFFFNSTKIFGENYDYELTNVGTVITFKDNHTVSLTRADIDTAQNVIEYEFSFDNRNFDGNNDYKIQIKTTSRTGKIRILNPQIICADSDVYVIRAGLPPKWTAAVANITLIDDENKKYEAKFYSNRETLYPCSISGVTREDFLKLDTERSIERLNLEINHLNEDIAALENKILQIDESILTLQNRMPYMTADEIEEANASIISMTSEKATCVESIDNNKKRITEYQNDILTLTEQQN